MDFSGSKNIILQVHNISISYKGYDFHVYKEDIIKPEFAILHQNPNGIGRWWCSVANYVQLFITLWTVAHQAPLSMGFSGKSTGVGGYFLLQIHLVPGLYFEKY